MRTWFNTPRRAYTVALLTGLLFVVGVAFAQWLATGTGEGYAKAGSAQPLETVSASAVDDLYPGGSGTLVLAVHNPNPFPVTITDVAGNGPITADPACGEHGVTFNNQTGLNLVVGAGADVTFNLAGAVAMDDSSPNACQGAVFTIPVSLNGGSGGTPPPTDADEDGYASDIDCDDDNPTVHPGAEEVDGDGIDQNCDGQDSEVMTCGPGWVNMNGVCFELDIDGDGYDSALYAGSDCDDSNDTVFPGAPELPDLLDNDCDGVVDNGVSCDDGNQYTIDSIGETGCVHIPVPDGQPCNDNNSNTIRDVTSGGECVGQLDSDHDNWTDAEETAAGTNPYNANSYPGSP